MKSKKIKIGLSVVVVVIVVLTLYVTVFSKDETKNANAEITYEQATVQKGNIEIKTSGTGNIEAGDNRDIFSDGNGIVENILVKEGDKVYEGDVLMTLEDNAYTDVDANNEDIIEAEDELDRLLNSNEALIVNSPYSGEITEILLDLEDEVSKGDTIANLINPDKVYITGYFDKDDSKRLEVGNKAKINLTATSMELEGIVNSISKLSNDNDQIKVIVEVDKDPEISEDTSAEMEINSMIAENTEEYRIDSEYPLIAEVDGKISELNIQQASSIEKGSIVAELINQDINNEIEAQKKILEDEKRQLIDSIKSSGQSAIYAPITGIITDIVPEEGDKVSNTNPAVSMSNLENFKVTLPIDELDINKIEIGQEAIITVSAIEDKTFSGVVSHIAEIGESNNGVTTFNVTLDLEDSEGLKSGMTTNGEILSESAKNTLLLPIEAAQNMREEYFVLVKSSEEDPQRLPIEVGLISENYVEIKSGLSEGDEVVYPILANNSSDIDEKGMNIMGIPGGMNPGSKGQGVRPAKGGGPGGGN